MGHWNFYASSGSPSLLEATQYYLPTLALKFIYELNHQFISLRLIELFILFHLVVGAVGFYYLMRTKNIKAYLCSFAGLIFIITGYMPDLFWVSVFALSLLPWLLILLQKYLTSGRYHWLFLSSLMMFQLFAAAQQGFIYSLFFIILYFWSFDELNKNTIKRLAFFVLLTLIYASVITIPSLEFGKYIARTNYVDWSYINIRSTKISNIFDFVIFNFTKEYEYSRFYIGAVSAILICTIFAKKIQSNYKMLFSALFLLIYGLNATIIQSLVHFVPVLSSLRMISRVNAFIVIFLVIMLIFALNNYKPNFKREIKISLCLTVMILSSLLVLPRLQNQEVIFSLFFMAIFILVLFAYGQGIIREKYLIAVICVIIFIDLSHAFIKIRDENTIPYAVNQLGQFANTEWFLRNNLEYNRKGQDNASKIHPDQYLADGYNSFLITKNYSGGSFSGASAEFSPAILKNYDIYLKAAKTNTNLYALANINQKGEYLPRAFLVGCYEVAKDETEAFDTIIDKNFTGADRVVLFKEPEINNLKKIDKKDVCPARLIQVGARDGFDEIIFDTIKTESPTILFISDNYYPGWDAYVNGEKKGIMIANYTFKAVALPSGINQVKFIYEPKIIRWASLVTFISLAVSLMILIYLLIVSYVNVRKIKRSAEET